MGNEGSFCVRSVLVKVRDGFPSHNPSVFGTLSLIIFTLKGQSQLSVSLELR